MARTFYARQKPPAARGAAGWPGSPGAAGSSSHCSPCGKAAEPSPARLNPPGTAVSAPGAADLHRQWLTIFWGQYSKEAHSGLAELYVDDPRFTAYYDREQPGTARFLRDAIRIYTGSERRG